MVVSPVDEGDIDIFPAEQPGSGQAAETTPDDDDTVALTGPSGRLHGFVPGRHVGCTLRFTL